MKNLLLIVMLMTCFSAVSFAQLGKMQYEDAEEQFAAGKFKEALSLLDESEKTMGKSNPMIDHLRIMARTELLKKDLAANIGQLEIAQNEAKAFLARYDGDTRVEDKYREVYKASKTLAAFPSPEELEKKIAEAKQIEEEKKRDEAANFLPGYKDGMTAADAKKIPGFMTQHSSDTLQTLFFNNYRDVVFVSPKTGLCFGYMVHHQYPKTDKACTGAMSKYHERKAEVTRVLGVEPFEKKPSQTTPSQAGAGGLTALVTAMAERNTYVCKWTKGTKTITLTMICQQLKRSTNASVMLISDNNKFR
ncbi:hypothetical protein ACFOTA_15335 [Chitinophaga sp. GCM10012297]|uniref:Uncharacterized protein n=1 Tax=Chitinophaga chungangae TaxID=2821488 RepID=A0ABS3YH30_9BACT|nr:hypothetical protein [Chitinophaga chungangae]MBO9153593.1 hypothetical protein [Chitinophaga chungangae]